MEQRTANDEAEPEGKELEHEDAEDDGVYTIDIVLPCPWHSLPGKKKSCIFEAFEYIREGSSTRIFSSTLAKLREVDAGKYSVVLSAGPARCCWDVKTKTDAGWVRTPPPALRDDTLNRAVKQRYQCGSTRTTYGTRECCLCMCL